MSESVAVNALLMKEDGEYFVGCVCKSLFQCRNVYPEKGQLWREKLYV